MGLYRSRLHFFLRDRFPGEEKAGHHLPRAADHGPHPVVLRTLDVGGDKPLPYFPISEQNPVSGLARHPHQPGSADLFKPRLRAMLRASAVYPNLAILFSMIGGVGEVERALDFCVVPGGLREDGVPVFSNAAESASWWKMPSAVSIDRLVRMVDSSPSAATT